MALKSKLRLASKLSLTKTIRLNYLDKRVTRKGGGKILPFRGAVVDMGRDAKIVLGDGNLVVNANKPRGSRREAYVWLRENGVLEVRGTVTLNYGATIEVHRDAKVSIGSAAINTGAVILAARSIEIGEGCLISRDVSIYDADHHPIYDDEGNVKNPPRPVAIGDHVWIGVKSTILRGCRIGAGAVIAANSLVGGRIKAGTMASGNPARPHSKVKWSISGGRDGR